MHCLTKGLTRRAFLGSSAATAGTWLLEGCRTFEQTNIVRW